MNYLSADRLSKQIGLKVLFSEVTFFIDRGQKVALVARNGAGKSSLLNVLMGYDKPDSGTLQYHPSIRVSFLEQDPVFDQNLSLLQAVLQSDNEMTRAILDYETALLNPDNSAAMQKAFNRMDAANAWDYENRLKEILGKLRLSEYDKPVNLLSGGQKKRLALARVLIEEPDFVILDEPTNHLDLSMIEWLEQYLSQSGLTLLMVTHDRYFLERVCDQILELDNGKIYKYSGNYDQYLLRKSERQENLAKNVERAQSLMRSELEWIRRQPKARSTKAKSRVDAFEVIRERASQRVKVKSPIFDIKHERLGGKILEFHHVRKAFGELKVLEDFSYKFKKGEKVGIVGPNGVGKTTFLKMITGEVQPDGGKIVLGETVKPGIYRQDGLQVKEDKRALEVVTDIAGFIPLNSGTFLPANAFMERFLFSYDEQHTFVSKLSGGERRRLYLMTVLMENPNLLILDEPTNDLDILTLNVLEEFLNSFEGCVIVVSHDRYFMDKIVDHLFVFEGDGKVSDFPGNYSDWRAFQEMEIQLEREQKQLKAAENPAEEQPAKVREEKARVKLSFKEKIEYDRLNEEIPALEAKKTEIEQTLSSGNLNHQELADLSDQYNQLLLEIEVKTDRWLELSEFA